jgi:hypothetical protein
MKTIKHLTHVSVMLLLAVGCASQPHVHLTAPAAGASAEERLAAYESLHPRAEANTLIVSNGTVQQSTDFLVLGDGRRVYHADDLAPVVGEQSPTAEAGHRSAHALSHGKWWLRGGAIAAAVGIAATVVGFATADMQHIGRSAALVGGGIAFTVVGSTVAMIGAMSPLHEANDERVSAFATYDQDLRKRLALCARGMQIVACDAVAPAAPAAPAAVLSPPTAAASVAP